MHGGLPEGQEILAVFDHDVRPALEQARTLEDVTIEVACVAHRHDVAGLPAGGVFGLHHDCGYYSP